MMFQRYALFYTPPDGPLAARGASWLGWDSAAGRDVAQPDWGDLDAAALTKRPRRYGFHATLKAPFRLASGASESALIEAVQTFAGAHTPLPVGRMWVSHTHRFVALRPVTQTPKLSDRVATIVRQFDQFRAPLTQTDIARRRRARLTDRQDAQMMDWGYPYIFDDFQFHMTLTGPLPPDRAAYVAQSLNAIFAPVLPDPLMLDAITVMGEDGDGRFHQLQRCAFDALR